MTIGYWRWLWKQTKMRILNSTRRVKGFFQNDFIKRITSPLTEALVGGSLIFSFIIVTISPWLAISLLITAFLLMTHAVYRDERERGII